MSPAEAESALTFDPEARTFTFYNRDDLSLSGEDYQTYIVQVTGESGAVWTVEKKSMFYFVIKNPCLDSDFVEIVSIQMNDYSYCLYDEAPSGMQWTHSPFQVKTVPFEHTMCGEITSRAIFRGDELTLESEPIRYDSA